MPTVDMPTTIRTRSFSNSDEASDEEASEIATIVLFKGRICRLQPVKEEEAKKYDRKDLPRVEVVKTYDLTRDDPSAPSRRSRSRSRSKSRRSSSSGSRSRTPKRSAVTRKSFSRERSDIEREIFTGEIARIVDKNNFGFIKIDRGQKGCPYKEMFFHRQCVKGNWDIQDLSRGDRVQLRYEMNKQGRPQAWDVVLVGTAVDTPSPSPDRDWVEGFITRLNMEKQFGYITPKRDIGYSTVWFHNSFIENRISIRQLKTKDKVTFTWEDDPNHRGRIRVKQLYISNSQSIKDRKRVYEPKHISHSRSRSRSFARRRSRNSYRSRSRT